MEQKILEIAQKVKALSPDQRQQFFQSVCAENSALAAAIRDHLGPTSGDHDTETLSENRDYYPDFSSHLVGKKVGSYLIEQPLGEGGMGYVFLGSQEQPLRRKVAIKIIKPGMNSSLVLNRFSAERQALALMNHTHIAKIFDAGVTEEGLPYFVMEYIQGKHITTYCDDKQFSIGQRIELFMQVCDAIQHANQNGILHRDLKPSNVLVTEAGGNPQVKIIDFGIAKAVATSLTEESFHTEHGIVVGTLEYMSPEQLSQNARDIDTRSDVYTLGVLLQEILSGMLPFIRRELKDKDFFSVQRHVLFSDPVKPSRRLASQSEEKIQAIAEVRSTTAKELNRLLRGDLDWIVLKAQAKVRDHRYVSPHNLKADLQRYLQRMPVLAGPPTFSYRFKKFASRHRFAVSLSAILLVALLGAFLTVSYALVETRRANSKSESTVALLENFLVSVDPDQQGPNLKVVTLLENFESRLDEIQDRDVKFRLSHTMAATFINIGQNERAIQIYQSILDQLDGASESDRVWYAKTKNDQLSIQIELAPTEALAAEATHIQKKCLAWFGPNHSQTQLAEWNLALIHQDLGHYEKALELGRQLLPKNLATFGRYKPRTISTMSVIGASLSALDRVDEALKLHQEIYEISKVVFGEDSPKVLSTKVNLSNAFDNKCYFSRTLRLRQEAYKDAEKLLGENHVRTLWIRESLALSYATLGYDDEALALLQKNLQRGIEALGESHMEVAYTQSSLALTHISTQNFKSALEHGTKALQAFQNLVGPEHNQTLSSQEVLARVHFGLGDLDTALAIQEKVVAARREIYGEGAPLTIRSEAFFAALHIQNEPHQAMQRFDSHYENMQSTYSKMGALKDLLVMLQHMKVEELFANYYPVYFEMIQQSMEMDAPLAQRFVKSYRDFALNQGQTELARELKAHF